MRTNFLQVADNIEFSLFSGYTAPDTGVPNESSSCYGVTHKLGGSIYKGLDSNCV